MLGLSPIISGMGRNPTSLNSSASATLGRPGVFSPKVITAVCQLSSRYITSSFRILSLLFSWSPHLWELGNFSSTNVWPLKTTQNDTHFTRNTTTNIIRQSSSVYEHWEAWTFPHFKSIGYRQVMRYLTLIVVPLWWADCARINVWSHWRAPTLFPNPSSSFAWQKNLEKLCRCGRYVHCDANQIKIHNAIWLSFQFYHHRARVREKKIHLSSAIATFKN